METLLADILEEFECPVCTFYMIPPIRICLIGHSFCDRCNTKLHNCPICRHSKSGVRNFGMENIFNKLYVPCRNASKGCPVEVPGSALKNHQKTCQYITKICPLKAIGNCQWNGPAMDCIPHCFQQHPGNTYASNRIHLLCPRFQGGQFMRPTELGECYHIIIQAYGQLFKCMWDMRTTNGFMKWCVVCMDPDANPDRYYFELIFHNQGSHVFNGRALFRRSRCQGIRREVSQENRWALTHIDVLRMFSGEQGLLYTLSIFQLDEGVQSFEDVMGQEPNVFTRAELVGKSFAVPEPSLYLDLNDSALHDLRRMLVALVEEEDHNSTD